MENKIYHVNVVVLANYLKHHGWKKGLSAKKEERFYLNIVEAGRMLTP